MIADVDHSLNWQTCPPLSRRNGTATQLGLIEAAHHSRHKINSIVICTSSSLLAQGRSSEIINRYHTSHDRPCIGSETRSVVWLSSVDCRWEGQSFMLHLHWIKITTHLLSSTCMLYCLPWDLDVSLREVRRDLLLELASLGSFALLVAIPLLDSSDELLDCTV